VNTGRIRAATTGGAIYFAVVFSIAFVLGVIRTLVLAPRLGAMTSIAIEVPILLVVSWFACHACLRRFPVRPATPDRAWMGMVAFALLICAELLLSILMTDRSIADFFAAFAQPEQKLGLAGQVAFALVPVIQALLPPRGQPSG
jgi:hypothetical protein